MVPSLRKEGALRGVGFRAAAREWILTDSRLEASQCGAAIKIWFVLTYPS
jgi:hypothetical protein